MKNIPKMISVFFVFSNLHSSISFASDKPIEPSSNNFINQEIYGKQELSFNTFSKEFIFTNSLDDYFRSLSRLHSLFGLEIPNIHIGSVYEIVDLEKHTYLKNIIFNLAKDAHLKSSNEENSFYRTLEQLHQETSTIQEAAMVELMMVELQRQLGNKIVPFVESNNISRFLHLIQHARYEVFSTFLSKMSKAD